MPEITLPLNISFLQLAGVCVVAFLAGFIDATSGGGGLVQLPGVMTCLPNVPVVTLLAINKTSSVLGTSVATIGYAKKGLIDFKRMWRAALLAMFTSAFGANMAKRVPNEFLKPLIIVLMAFMLIFTIVKKDFGNEETKSRFTEKQQALLGCVMGLLIGFYDGFFGPGTGNFLIMALIFIYGLDFLHASADAKLVNLATNIAAMAMYISLGVGNLVLGVTMGIFNMAGSALGVKLAVLKGSKYIRVLFIVVSAGLLIKQIVELIG